MRRSVERRKRRRAGRWARSIPLRCRRSRRQSPRRAWSRPGPRQNNSRCRASLTCATVRGRRKRKCCGEFSDAEAVIMQTAQRDGQGAHDACSPAERTGAYFHRPCRELQQQARDLVRKIRARADRAAENEQFRIHRCDDRCGGKARSAAPSRRRRMRQSDRPPAPAQRPASPNQHRHRRPRGNVARRPLHQPGTRGSPAARDSACSGSPPIGR